jgi:hypothetical protein
MANILGCQPTGMHYLDDMDWQQAVALLIVAVTAGFFLRARLRPRKFSFERDTHCGCASQPATQGSIVFHARKGERPQIVVKSK